MIETIRQGLGEDGFKVSISKLCRWFGVPRRTFYYRTVKAPPKLQERLVEPVKAMIEGGVTQRWPASILQHHPDVTVLLDEAAASKLELADFYKEVWEKEHL